MNKSKHALLLLFLIICAGPLLSATQEKPNTRWISIEDPALRSYDDNTVPTVPTPHKRAKNGLLLEKCFAPAAVCGATRSAIISAKVQTSIGAHNSAYNKDTLLHLPDYLGGNSLPELFRQGEYLTFHQGKDHYISLITCDLVTHK